MTAGTRRIILTTVVVLGGLSLLIAVTAVELVQTQWFRGFVTQKIISAAEDATGGKAEVGSLDIDWRQLQATLTNLVIHGTEPRSAAPLLRVPRIRLDLRLFAGIHHLLDVTYLGVDQPMVNVMVFPDGHTNIPSPKPSPPSQNPPLKTIVHAAIGHFDLNRAAVSFADAKQMLDVHADDFRAQVYFDPSRQGYHGELSFQPLYVMAGRNSPVKFTVKLPVSVQGDRIALNGATITTPQSSVRIDGSAENLRNPNVTVHVSGRVSVSDLKSAGDLPLDLQQPGIPSEVSVEADATASQQAIQVARLRIAAGQSEIQASGPLKDPRGNGSLSFQARFALAQIGRMAQSTARPDGMVNLKGTARLDAANRYNINANMQAQNVSLRESGRRIGNADLSAEVHLDPRNLTLSGFRLAFLGAVIEGGAALQDFTRYQVHAELRNLTLRSLAGFLGEQLPYNGTITGPIQAAGDLKSSQDLTAQIRLSIAPGRGGIPVSGKLAANYTAAGDDLQVEDSYLALPHSRLNVSGTVAQRLNVALVSTDLSDFTAAIPSSSHVPVRLQGRGAEFTGEVTGGLAAAKIAGRLRSGAFDIEGRHFDRLALDVQASGRGASINQAEIVRGTMLAQFSARVGLDHWKPTSSQPLRVRGGIRNSDLADVMALAGQPVTDTSGALEASAQIDGTIGNPLGSANVSAMNGMLRGEPFDRIQATVNLADQLIAIPSAAADRGSSRITLTAELRHARSSFTDGNLHAQVRTTPIDLSQIRTLQRERPNTGGSLQVDANATAELRGSDFQLSSVNGDISARGLRLDGEDYGDLTAGARSNGQTVQYRLTSTFAGSNLRVSGNTQLRRDYPTSLDANLSNLPVERVLAAARRTDIPARGRLSGTAHFSGTIRDPTGEVDLDLRNAVLYQEPVQRVHAKAAYQAQRIEISELQIAAAGSHLELSARFDHPRDDFKAGNLRFHLDSTPVNLTRIRNLQMRRPGLGGMLRLAADGSAELRMAEPRVSVRQLMAEVALDGVSLHGRNFGDVSLTADGQNNRVNFSLNSNLAGSNIQGQGNADLAGDYPLDARLRFGNVEWAHLQPLIQTQVSAGANFNAAADGEVTVQGPVKSIDQLRGSLSLSRVDFSARSGTGRGATPVSIHNQGPISANLDRGVIRIRSAHLSGDRTDLQARGTVSLRDRSLNLTLNADANLALLQALDKEFTSSGALTLAAKVGGSPAQPAVDGTLQLKDASVNYAQFPNGLSKANGTVAFSGNTATVRNLTAESGGGKLTLSGFVLLAASPQFDLKANASQVRVRVQQGASIVTDGNIELTGTQASSTLSGRATITRVTYAPRTDLGSILTRSAPSVTGEATPSPLLDNMKLDFQVQTSDALMVQSALAQSLQGDANLRVRGTASHPSVLGRVNLTEGSLTFFGSTYSVNEGTISFYNPIRIEPVLDISLETNTKGVDVTLRVTGPIENMKLSYTSDPPLQFEEIIGLLASGKTPTSDPTLLANYPPQQQTVSEMGESAILGQALANPIANRLQRVFGVTQLKIDPQFTNGSDVPQAELSLQQQIASNITFTYVTQVDNANAETIRVDVTLNPRWSAAAMRDENGIFSINLFYKRQIH